MFYYVYLITNIVNNKQYIGSRGSRFKPEDDLGIRYYSSSRDANFINDQKTYPQNFRYEILKNFDTRSEATTYEISQHIKNDIPNNHNFYNRARQRTSSFSTSGVLFVDGIKISCQDYKNKAYSSTIPLIKFRSKMPLATPCK